ncbi:hypothetical protein ACO0QE_002492 [Hanseniaspora vineae]
MVSDAAKKRKNQKKKLRAKLKKQELQQGQQEQQDKSESRQNSAGTDETNDSSLSTNDEETEFSDNDQLDFETRGTKIHSEFANPATTSANFLNSTQEEYSVDQHANEVYSITDEVVEDVAPKNDKEVVDVQNQDPQYTSENNDNTLLLDDEETFDKVNKNDGNSDNLFDEKMHLNNDDLFGPNDDQEEHIEFLADNKISKASPQNEELQNSDPNETGDNTVDTSAVQHSSVTFLNDFFPSAVQTHPKRSLEQENVDASQKNAEGVLDTTFQNSTSDFLDNEHDGTSAELLADKFPHDIQLSDDKKNKETDAQEKEHQDLVNDLKVEKEQVEQEEAETEPTEKTEAGLVEDVKLEAVDEAKTEAEAEAVEASEPVEEAGCLEKSQTIAEVSPNAEAEKLEGSEPIKEAEHVKEPEPVKEDEHIIETALVEEPKAEITESDNSTELPEEPASAQYETQSGMFDNGAKLAENGESDFGKILSGGVEKSETPPQEPEANTGIQSSESNFDDIFGASENNTASDFLSESVNNTSKEVPADNALFSNDFDNEKDFASMINSAEEQNALNDNVLEHEQKISAKDVSAQSHSSAADVSKPASPQEEIENFQKTPFEEQTTLAKTDSFSNATETSAITELVPAGNTAAQDDDSLLASSDEENLESLPKIAGKTRDEVLNEADSDEMKQNKQTVLENVKNPENTETVLQKNPPLEKNPDSSAVEQSKTQEKFAFLSDDDDLLDDDDDSFLASDDDIIESMSVSKTPLGDTNNHASNLSSKNVAKANISFPSNEKGSSSLNRYAPSTATASLISEPLGATYQAQQTAAVKPNIVQPTLNFIQPRGSVTPSFAPNPPVSDQSTNSEAIKVTHDMQKQKQKTDAYDFPIDLVSNLKKPAKAKPVAVKVAPAQRVSTVPTQPQQSTLPGIPINAGPQRTSSASSGSNLPVVNPYAPKNPSVASTVSPPVATTAPVGIVPPPLSNTKDFSSNNNTMAAAPKNLYAPPASTNTFVNMVSNTDLPAGLVPSVTKIEKPLSSPVNPYAPTNLGNRSRAFSNASSQNNSTVNRNPATIISSKPNPYAPSAKARSRTASINSQANSAPKPLNSLHPPAGGQKTGPSNPYAPNQSFHARRNSSLKEANAPLRNRTSSLTGNNPAFNPASKLPALQTLGLNNVMGVAGLSSPTGMSPVGGTKKKSHARSHSSVYAPSGAGNASKYAPTVHPNYHQQQPSNSNFGPQTLSSAPPPFGFKRPSSGSTSNSAYDAFSQQSVSQSSHPIPNPETLRARQFPIFHWNGNTKAVYMLPTNGMYQQTPITICDSKKFDVVPQYFIDFPGPLAKGKTKAKNLETWFNTAIDQFTGGRDDVADLSVLLWKIIQWKVVSADGKLSEIAGMLYDTTDLDIILNDMSLQHTSAARKFNAFKLEPQDQMQVLASLQVGNHSRALSLAMSHNDYPMAMIISSLMGKEKWSEVVDIYLRSEFNAGNDHEFSANLLGVIFQVFVGNSKKLIDDFYGDINKATWALDNWNVILAAIFANSQDLTDLKTPNSVSPLILEFLIDFGIFLLRRKQTLAAHICFVIADVPLSFNEIIPESQVIFDFVGSPNSFDSVLLSELYEFAFKPNDSQAFSKFAGFQTLVSQKLLHASILFENNSGTLASKYIDTASAVLKHLPKNSPVSVKYMYFIDELKSRVSNINNGWLGKPTLSGVWGQLDKSFNKFIGGDDLTQLEKVPTNENKVFDSFTPNPSRTSSHVDLSASLNGSVYNPLRAQPVGPLHNNQANSSYTSPSLLKNDANAQGYLPNYGVSGVKSVYEPRSNVTKHAVSQLRSENAVQRSGPPSVGSIVSSENLLLGTSSPRSHIRNPSIESTLVNPAAARVPAAKRPSVSDIPASSSTQAFTSTTVMPPKQAVNKRHSVTFSSKGAGKSGSVVSLDELYGAPSAPIPSQNLNPSPQKLETNHEQNTSSKNEEPTDDLTNKNAATQKDASKVAQTVVPSFESSSFAPSSSPATGLSVPVQEETTSFAPAAAETVSNLSVAGAFNGLEEKTSENATSSDSNDVLLTFNAEDSTNNAPELPVDHRETITKAANFSFPPRDISPQLAAPNFTEKKSLSPHAPDLLEGLVKSPVRDTLQNSNSPGVSSYSSRNADSKSALSQKYVNSYENTSFQNHSFEVQYEADHSSRNEVGMKTPSAVSNTDTQESAGATSNYIRTNSSILNSPAKTAGSFNSTFAPPPPVFGGSESMRMRTPTNSSSVHTPIRSHSRTSSQLLADLTGNTKASPAPEGTPGADPVIRQVRVNSVVYTPETSINQNVYYDDIVEEEDSDDEEEKQEKERAQKEAAEKEKRELEQRRKEEEEAKKKAKAKKESGKKEDSKQAAGWFGWLKNGNDPNAKKPVKAKLGHKNTFYYDEKLKRWVDKNATEEEKAAMVETSAPPPPPIIKRKAATPEIKPRSGSVAGGPTQRTLGMVPPKNPLTGESLIPETETSYSAPSNADIPAAIPEEASTEITSLPSSAGSIPSLTPTPTINLAGKTSNGLDDLISLTARRRATPAGTRKGRRSGRGYVNVMDNMNNA